MKHFTFIIVLFVYPLLVKSQVGINTISPKASLDITATNQANPSNTDGLLIPRIDDFPATSPTAAQQGMMVYLTITSGTNPSGYYYWNNGSATWINVYGTDKQKVNQFGLSGTILGISLENDGVAPITVDLSSLAGDDDWTDVGVDIERQTGDVYIGDTNLTNNDLYISNKIIDWDNTAYNLDPDGISKVNKIEFENGSPASPSILFSDLDTGFFSPLANTTAYSVSGTEAFRFNNQGNIAIGSTSIPISNYKMYIKSGPNLYENDVYIGNTNNSNSSILINHNSQRGNGIIVNANNNYSLSNHSAIATSNSLANIYTNIAQHSTTSNIYGINSTIQGFGNYTIYGVYNYIPNTGGGTHYGTQNRVIGSGDGIHYGTYNFLAGNGSGLKYGSYNSIIDTAGGTHYGVYSNVQKASGYAGYFIGRMSFGNTSSRYLMPATDGSPNQVMYTNGSGILNWTNTSSLGTDDQNLTGATLTGTSLQIDIENGNSTTVELSSLKDADWFKEGTTISPNNISDNIFTHGFVGIGDSMPDSILDVEYTGVVDNGVSIIYNNTDNSGPTNALQVIGENISGSTSNITSAYIQVKNSIGANHTTAVYAFNTASGNKNIGLSATAGGAGQNNFGNSGTANGASQKNYGGFFTANSTIGNNYGVKGYAFGSATNWAGYFGDLSTIPDVGSGNVYIQDLLQVDGALKFTNGANNNYILKTDASGNAIWVDPTTIFTDTDNQQIDQLSLSGTTLNISLQDDGVTPSTVDLSSLQDGTGTDNQNLTSATLTGTSLAIAIENGTGATVDLAPLQDADWYEAGGTPPNSINDNIYTNGKVGINNPSPSSSLDIITNSSGSIGQLSISESQANDGSRILFKNSVETSNKWTLYARADNTATDNYFNVHNTTVGDIITIKGDGKVGIGTAPSYKLDVSDSQSSSFVARISNSSTNQNADGLRIRLAASSLLTTNYFIGFYRGIGSNSGKIVGNGTGVLYQTTSDRRLKTNIVSIENALEKIEKIQPRKYEYKANLGTKEYGFIAQELQLIYPQAVSGDPNGNVETDPMMVDYSRLTPILTAGIIELKTEIELLKEENQKLRERINKFESIEARLIIIESKITNRN